MENDGTTSIGKQTSKKCSRPNKTLREISVIQIKRDAKQTSAEQISIFANTIIPEMVKFDELRKKGKYPILSKSSVTENFPNITYNVNDLTGLCKEIVYSNNRLAIKILNRIECFAIYYTSGVADADMAYRPLCNTYCEFVNIFLPYIVYANSADKQFSNLLAIYTAWAGRNKIEKTNQEISKHNDTLNTIKVHDFKPFGIN